MIDTLSSEQSDFLKKVRDQEIRVDRLTQEEQEWFEFLEKKKYVYIDPLWHTKTSELLSEKSRVIAITPEGLQYLEWEKEEEESNKRSVKTYWIAVATLISTIVLGLLDLIIEVIR